MGKDYRCSDIANMYDMQTIYELFDQIKKIHKAHSSHKGCVLSEIIRETSLAVDKVIPFECFAFALVDEGSSDIHIEKCFPVEKQVDMEHELDSFVLHRSLHYFSHSMEAFVFENSAKGHRLVVQPLGNGRRVKGLFLGVVSLGCQIPDFSLSILRNLMFHFSGALEGYEISRLITSTERIAHKKAMEIADSDSSALYDPLTQTPNRNLLFEKFDDCIRQYRRRDRDEGYIGFLLIDLDDFKWINDTYGHLVGDRFLYQVASRIWSSLRDSDVVARFGGDEFAVLLPFVNSEEDAVEVGRRVHEKLCGRPLWIDGYAVQAGASIGVCLYPEHGKRKDDIVEKADLAMYAAKKSGGGVLPFTPSHDDNRREREDVVNKVKNVLNEGDYRLVLSPIQSIEGACVYGYDVSIAWENLFVCDSLSRESIKHYVCGTRVMDIVVTQMIKRILVEQDQLNSNYFYMVNVPEIPGKAFVDNICSILNGRRFSENVVLAFDESVFLLDEKKLSLYFEKIKGVGANIAIDNFGDRFLPVGNLQRFDVRLARVSNKITSCKDSCHDWLRLLEKLDLYFGVRIVLQQVKGQDFSLFTGSDVGISYYQANSGSEGLKL